MSDGLGDALEAASRDLSMLVVTAALDPAESLAGPAYEACDEAPHAVLVQTVAVLANVVAAVALAEIDTHRIDRDGWLAWFRSTFDEVPEG